ncbi:MAG: response regulator [Deltaproteobacteria bacterium]|nr:response regulator [Deltaproteobacteria bacterium]
MPGPIHSILIVDDSTIVRRVMRRQLEALGDFALYEAVNGAEGVALYMEHRPDLVFLDLTMPVMGGEEALALIRAHDPTALVVVATADVQRGSRERVEAAGAWRMLPKPIHADVLSTTLASAYALLGG